MFNLFGKQQDSGYEGEGPDWPPFYNSAVVPAKNEDTPQEALVEHLEDFWFPLQKMFWLFVVILLCGLDLYLFITQKLT